jgi:hypothetical protein
VVLHLLLLLLLLLRRRRRRERVALGEGGAAHSTRPVRRAPSGLGLDEQRREAMANALGAYDEVTGFNVLFWMIAFGLICGLMFTCLYSLFTLTDLESDMINPMDACQRLNKMTKYEFFMLVRGATPALPASSICSSILSAAGRRQALLLTRNRLAACVAACVAACGAGDARHHAADSAHVAAGTARVAGGCL